MTGLAVWAHWGTQSPEPGMGIPERAGSPVVPVADGTPARAEACPLKTQQRPEETKVHFREGVRPLGLEVQDRPALPEPSLHCSEEAE
ncbi:unnamed protein product [Rangifer tarandus platyrhynchus]|uniref:Uncharacterized protein n=1 Tax=Rangifer tarandus platyrhynchus TaxID=3082113 RepID=A0AC59YJL1_RANTA